MNAKITTGVFTAIVFIIALLNLFMPKRDFSESENRILAEIPVFSFESVFGGKFAPGFDSYISDHFVARDLWVGARTMSELALGKRSVNGVYVTESALIETFDSVDVDRFERNIEFLAEFSRRAADGLGIAVKVMLVPSPSMIYSETLPPFAPETDQSSLLAYASDRLEGFVDVSPALEAHAGEYIYYKTDHHWTSLGAFYAYNHWLAHIGLPERDIADFTAETLSESFYGTTYSKAGLYTVGPDTLTAMYPADLSILSVDYNDGETTSDSIYERSYLDVKDKYSVFFNSNQPITRVKTDISNGRRLLIIKDSYANAFAQLLLADFEELIMVDPRFYRTSVYDFIAENSVTDVLALYSLKGFAVDANIYYLTQ